MADINVRHNSGKDTAAQLFRYAYHSAKQRYM